MKRPIMHRIAALLLTSLCLLLSPPACSASDAPTGEKLPLSSQKVVARVGADPISEGDVLRRIQAAYGVIDRKKVTPNQWQMMLEAATDSEIIDKLLFRSAVSEGLTVPEGKIDEILRKTKELMGEDKFTAMLAERGSSEGAFKEFLRERELVAIKKERLFSTIAIDDAAVKEYYEGHRKEYTMPESVRLELFVLKEKEKAEEIARRWKKGEDFAKLSADFEKGGEQRVGRRLRWTPYEAMPMNLQAQVREGKADEILGPTESDSAFYVVKILGKRKAGAMEFDEVQEKIREEMRAKREQKILDDWFAAEKEKVTIEYIR